MNDAVSTVCTDHPHRYDCPDALIAYIPKFDEYGILIHDGGTAKASISFCPWCGTKLPDSRRDQWFGELERLGLDPDTDELPVRMMDAGWWST